MERFCRSVGPLSLELIPELGGVISKLIWNEQSILRSLPDDPTVTVNQGGGFVLVPYSNRIAEGQFHFADRDYTLQRNFANHPHSIHGNGWQRPWQVKKSTDKNRITLTLYHDAQGQSVKQWPWPYRATQCFTLKDNALHIRLTYHNLANHSVIAGLGFHPYFPNAKQAEIQFEAEGVIINGDDALPTRCAPIPGYWDYRNWRKPEPATIDNCFYNWNGSSRVRWPDKKLMVTISSPDAPHAVLFIPPADRDFIAIEPVSHINNAINNLGFGDPALTMTTVPANGQCQLTMLLEISHYV
ncbi:aldose 1-epimerase [Vibrio metschnikovii]|uniref:aldose 1-epimerase n=1 Tax=Vibrio metschnikovii TaxID=28172 RepID=UPI00130297D8|nr:aldose 1-epimerase [Vibrio metschnikovii]